jgi:hypothetical protein
MCIKLIRIQSYLLLFLSVTHWSYWYGPLNLDKCIGIGTSTANARKTVFAACDVATSRLRVLPDGRIEVNDPAGWGMYSSSYLIRMTALKSIPQSGQWTLLRTRDKGQRLSVMLMNQDVPDPSKPDNVCMYTGYINSCEYSPYASWIVKPHCPKSYPLIGKCAWFSKIL